MTKELKTGIIAIIIIVAFIWGYNFLKGQNIFQPDARVFRAEYTNIAGLSKSSTVSINGLNVGKVIDIYFNNDPAKKGELVVEFTVENDFDFSKKTIAKIYAANPLANTSLILVPDYEGESAKSGDTLVGTVEGSLFSTFGEKLDPVQKKIESVLESTDHLLKNINKILDEKTSNSIQRSILDIEQTIAEAKTTVQKLNSILDQSSGDLKQTLQNTNKITADVANITNSLSEADFKKLVEETEKTITTMNAVLDKMNKNEGTIGKLFNDDALYNNITNATKEMEELLRELKLNPKRFVHFSLFGKKPKPYNPENNEANISNQ